MSRDDRLRLGFVGLHPARHRELVARHRTAGAVLEAIRTGRVDGVPPAVVRAPIECRAAVEEAGAETVFLGDGGYPPWLAGIEDPPDVLFVRGRLPERMGVGVVGTRRCTGYGRALATGYGRAIAAAGWVLVSGLARGIDATAQRAAVEAGGSSVAVLGCGVDVVYPREHADLTAAILDGGGAVVSEYPPGAPPLGWRFPPRNRIISGLSAAVVVVESAVRGGALVTAARAAEQGRAVFAVPGDVGRVASVGCNLLIRDGAGPVLDPADLVEALSLVLGPPAAAPAAAEAAGEPEMLGPAGVSMDEFGAALGLHGSELLALLGRLELEGKVRREGDLVMPA